MSQTVVGLFQSNDQAQDAKRELVEEGFASQNISVIANDSAEFNTGIGSNGSTTTAASTSSSSTHSTSDDEGIGTKISNWFHSLTGSDEHKDEVNYYSEGISRGGTVLAVTVPDDEADFVADWLRSHGAHDVEENAGVTQNRAASLNTAGTGVKGNQTAIPVVEEELQVGKRQVQRGGVRVYSHVTERPVEANVRLREEHIRVERRPVDRAATEADFQAGHNQSIELTETAEEAVVGKRSRVVEEVLVGKEATERTETVRDKVRRTDVSVEQVGGRDSARSFDDYDEDFRSDFKKNYGSTGATYDRYAPAYQYGYQLGNDPQYVSGDWNDVETRAKGDWATRGSGSSWDDMKQAVRTGWERTKSTVSGNKNQ